MSRSSLCLIDGNPPLGQLSACSTVNFWLQTQCDGGFGGCQPYLRQSTSLKASLWRAKPCSVIGKVVSQLDAPFSAAASVALFICGGSLSLISLASLASCSLRSVRVLFFARCCVVLTWGEYDFDWFRMSSTSGAVILSHAEW